MRTVKFRPLRIAKKTGKVTVAGYMQWRKVMTADYDDFNLIIDNSHNTMGKSAFVYNHKGEQLFFYAYNPHDIPVFQWSVLFNLETIRCNNEQYGILWRDFSHINYSMRGTDCDGVPTFSHYTAGYVATHYYHDIEKFEPLTVGIVINWYGWLLWHLNNSNLITL